LLIYVACEAPILFEQADPRRVQRPLAADKAHIETTEATQFSRWTHVRWSSGVRTDRFKG